MNKIPIDPDDYDNLNLPSYVEPDDEDEDEQSSEEFWSRYNFENEEVPCESCGIKAGYIERQPCPFSEDVYNRASECRCCEKCRYECAQDI